MINSTMIWFLIATLLILLIGIFLLYWEKKRKEIHKEIRKEVNKEKRRLKKKANK